MNGTKDLVNLSINLSEAVFLGTIDGVPALDDDQTFHDVIARVHDAWLYPHSYRYVPISFRVFQEDWENISLEYSIHYEMNGSGYSFEDLLVRKVWISSTGINTSPRNSRVRTG